MIFVDPLFQRVLVDVVRGPLFSSSSHAGLPVIFDEVFIGLYRLGFETSTSILGVNPDISVNAKILTGGLVPLAITMATEDIFRAFYSDKKADALLHGHSYTAYPVGCEVANETLKVLDRLQDSEGWKAAKEEWSSATDPAKVRMWSFWGPQFVNELSRLPAVGEVMTLGTVLAVKIADDSGGELIFCSQVMVHHLTIHRIYITLRATSPRLAQGGYARRACNCLGQPGLRHQLPYIRQRRILYVQPQQRPQAAPFGRRQDLDSFAHCKSIMIGHNQYDSRLWYCT